MTLQGEKVAAAVSWRQRKTTAFEVVAAAGVRGHVANSVAGLAATWLSFFCCGGCCCSSSSSSSSSSSPTSSWTSSSSSSCCCCCCCCCCGCGCGCGCCCWLLVVGLLLVGWFVCWLVGLFVFGLVLGATGRRHGALARG